MGSQNHKIPVPQGFRFSAVEAGIKYKNRKDLALIFSEAPATVAGVFTKNQIKAAPVVLTKRRIRSGTASAVLINSGNANACTGKKGLEDAVYLSELISEKLKVPKRQILVSSTGVIGTPLPVNRIERALGELIHGLETGSIEDVAKAIMTTDTFPKTAYAHLKAGRKLYTISGIAKGAGMIAPNMATMLSFILTDITITPGALSTALQDAVSETFNCITVDGDMSTNDMVIVMANGLAGGTVIQEHSKRFKTFRKLLYDVMDKLARMIASDGEGATKLVTIRVKGANSKAEARKAALTVANSPLVKTAIYGHDANWGRIMAALGRSGARLRENSISIKINNIGVVKNGLATGRDSLAGNSIKSSKEVLIDIVLGTGLFSHRIYTCDLTEEYIRINAEYRT